MMANGAWAEPGAKRLVLPGYFLKDIASDFLVKRDEAAADELRDLATSYIPKISKTIVDDIDLFTFWNTYKKYDESVRKLSMSKFEAKLYKTNPSFTERAMRFLAEEVFHGESFFLPSGLTAKGFLQESDRLMRCHGFHQRDFLLFHLVKVLDWLNDYYRIMCLNVDLKLDVPKLESKLSPVREKMAKWYESSEQPPFPIGTDILCEGIVEWRRCFITFWNAADRLWNRKDELSYLPKQKKGSATQLPMHCETMLPLNEVKSNQA